MISGSIVALVTPMAATGEIDWQSLHDLVDWHLQEKTDAIVAVGTTGESATLDVSEHCQVIKHIVEQVNHRIPVIAGTGANSTREAIELTAEARRLGADACLLVTPYYNKPTQEGLFQHHKAIAEAVEIPQILYNVPGRTGCDMQAATAARLSAIKNIIGIKEATGNIERGKEILSLAKHGFHLWSGDDESFVDLIAIGAKGNISVTANVAPSIMHAICVEALSGNISRAKEINAPLQQLHKTLFCESNPIPVKWALHRMGRIPAGIRLPLTTLATEKQPLMESALKTAGII